MNGGQGSVSASPLERVAAWDAAGNHDEAVNELARGVRAGDAHCTRLLGLRLLSGDRAPWLPAEGLRFLDDACSQGLPEAAARAAAIVALGVRMAANWPLALELLRKSAAAGWAPAQRQLLALCDDRELARRQAEGRADWKSLASAVDLAGWRRAPAADVRSQEPRVSLFPGMLRTEICQFFISMTEGRLVPARVYDPVKREDMLFPGRNNTLADFDLYHVELAHVLLQARMAAACGISARHMEAPSVLRYTPGQHNDDHYDFVDPKNTPDYAGEIARNGQRIVTFIVYLNEEYEAGETDFPRLGFSCKGRTGEGIYFVNALADLSPDLRMLHAGRPPVGGDKWIITQFVRSRPTR